MLPRFSLLSLVLLLAPLLPFSASAESLPVETEPLLRVEGKLEDSDPTLSEDKTRYDEYQFTGQAGQTITIVLESVEFDPYVLLKNSSGETIQQNDDYADDNRNSVITFTLPETGAYTIVASAYSAESRGSYRLTVLTGDEPIFLAAEEQIRLLAQTLSQYRAQGDRENEASTLFDIGEAYRDQGNYSESLEAYQRALGIYREINIPQLQAGSLSAIGNLYLSQSRVVLEEHSNYLQAYELLTQSLAAFQENLEIARRISDSFWESGALTGMGHVYGQRGNVAYAEGNYIEALDAELKSLQLFEQSLAINQQQNDAEGIRRSRNAVLSAHFGIINALNELEKYELALDYVTKAHELAGELENSEMERRVTFFELSIYISLGNFYNTPAQYTKLLEIKQQSIILARQLNMPGAELNALTAISQIHRFQGRYDQALEVSQQQLSRARETGNLLSEIFALQAMGWIADNRADYPEALNLYNQALAISQANQYRLFEISSLNNIAGVYQNQGLYKEALMYYKQSFSIAEAIHQEYASPLTLATLKRRCVEFEKIVMSLYDELNQADGQDLYLNQCEQLEQLPTGNMLQHFEEMSASFARAGKANIGTVLGNIGRVYSDQGDYPKALELFNQSLAIARELEDADGESIALNNIAVIYTKLGDYEKALELNRQVLETAINQNNYSNQITFRNNLGNIQVAIGSYPEALQSYQQVLSSAQQSGERSKEALILLDIGQVYYSQGAYAKALETANQALTIQQEIGEPANVALTLSALGTIHFQLGQYEQALNFHQQALDLTRKIGAGSQETGILLNIAAVYREQNKSDEALQTYQQALTIARSRGELENESIILTGIGKLYLSKAQPQDALSNLQQALTIQQQIGVRPAEADTLQAMGQAQTQLAQPTEAQTTLQQSLILAKGIGDRATEAEALANLGQLSAQQNQPEVAVAFYKQAVNLTEQIRQGLQTLSRDQQESYTETISDRYRELASLLLEQGKLLEAQQVLEMLRMALLHEAETDKGGLELYLIKL